MYFSQSKVEIYEKSRKKCHFQFRKKAITRKRHDINKIQKLSSFKSNENIHKKEDGSYYVVSANKASSVTL